MGRAKEKCFKSSLDLKNNDMENESILELTEENLIKCGFYELTIKHLLTRKNCCDLTTNKSGAFFATNIENKIYTGLEAFRKAFFKTDREPQFPFLATGLIPEYYELAESYYLETSKKRQTLIYDEKIEKQKFREREISNAIIATTKPKDKDGLKFNSNNYRFLPWNDYLTWLNRLNQSEPIDKNHTTKLSAPIIRRFCELCNNSGLDKKDPNENVIPYCERICLKFGLEYSDRVRQNFDNRNEPKQTDNHLKKVIELILPTLKASDREIIDNYIKPK
jgi:hypothetical protein